MDKLHHIAIIMDGNRRWAKARGLPTIEGHRKGVQALEKLSKTAQELDIQIITCWAFSTENWNRTKEEVTALMMLFELSLKKFFKNLIKNKIHLVHIGRKDRLPTSLIRIIDKAEKNTQTFKDYYFVIALDYGGHDEIVRAIKHMHTSGFNINNLTKDNFGLFLDTKNLPFPNPDLIIRTGGEERISGFMTWQNEYSELMFVKKYLPDFTPDDLRDCVETYMKRKRRFGK